MSTREVESHFRFGENWRSFVATVTEDSIAEAERGLARLFPDGALQGCRFLDIGCGSGLSMLAALRLGASEVTGLDIDPDSVAAAQQLLGTYANSRPWSVQRQSIFDTPADAGPFDVVYSWGVLHHTGGMWDAVERAAALVAPGGSFAVALYRKTPLCGLWKVEKRAYTAAPPLLQKAMRGLFKAAYVAGLVATGRNPTRYFAAYKSARGMSWHHDVHDWLGGYPYESTDPAEVSAFLAARGFVVERVFAHAAALAGVFGSHCDEFVARRSR